jgi:CcmD family protein
VDFLAQHQLYIVLIIAVGIWLGLYIYLFRLDGRLKKLERELHKERQ